MTKFFFALLMTTLTGSCLLGVWYIIGICLDRMGFYRLLYRSLQLLILFFFVPVMYLFAQIKRWIICGQGLSDIFFTPTPVLITFLDITSKIWLFILVLLLTVFLYAYKRERRRLACAFPADINTQEHLELCCQKLNIRRNVPVLYSYSVKTPMVYGFFREVILLPEGMLTEEELPLAIGHELVHIKSGDNRVRFLMNIITLLQWFNPCVWILKKLQETWSEYACDQECSDVFRKDKTYFSMITKIADASDLSGRPLYSGLSESNHQVLRRIKRMENYKNKKKRSRAAAAILIAAMILGSTGTVMAAGNTLVDGYEKMYNMTTAEDVLEDDAVEDEEVEYVEYYEIADEDEDVIEEYGDVYTTYGTGYKYINWTVDVGVRKTTYEFNASSGGSIYVSVSMYPAGKEAKVGIILPNGNRKCIIGSGDVSYTFNLTESGEYKVYIQNISDTCLSVGGHYAIR